MKMLNDEVNSSVLETLRKQRLFRYDCNTPEESEVSIFEKKFAKYVGSQYAVAMNSCSSALFVALLCAGIKPGDKVAIPAFTFIAVPSSIVHAGALPVLIEVTEDYVMDLNDFEAKVADGSVRALMLSYMRGRIPNLDKVIEICNKYNVIFLEDSAHSLGILYKGKQTGTFGIAGSYSAQSYKMIDSGEGGVLVTDNKDIAFKAMLYAGCYEHNWKKHFGTKDDVKLLEEMTNTIPAYNFRMSNLSAAALRPQLKNIEERIDYLNSNYQRLADILSSNRFIRIPDFTPGVRFAADSIQWEFVGLSATNIDNILSDLRKNNIHLDIFKGSNARNFWNWTFFECQETCSFTKELIQRTVDLRLRFHLEAKDIDKMGQEILNSVNKYS